MRKLLFVRHSLPELRRETPAADWHLSEAGAARARTFARQLPLTGATRIFTSGEPKAEQTARAIAEEWTLPVECVAGLHEHERPEAQLMSREAFEQKIRDLFERPTERIFGAETADQARRRFTFAVMRLVAGTKDDVVVVSHGTVMTLFVAEATGIDPFTFWKRQQMPFAAILNLPDLTLDRMVFLEESKSSQP